MAKADPKLTKLLDEIAAAAKRRAGRGAKARAIEQFSRSFYQNVSMDDLRGVRAEDLAGAALSIWDAMAQRGKGETTIRIYNPSHEKVGWDSSHTIIEIINDDMPFLVDSTTAAVNRLGAEVHLVIHPIMLVRRRPKGQLMAVVDESDSAGAISESVMHLQISEQPVERHQEIAAELAQVLAEVRVSVEDWRAMRARCRDLVDELEDDPPRLPHTEIAEGSAFLKWMDDDHFTYLGYREYRFEGRGAKATSIIDPKSGLGLLRDPDYKVFEGLRNLGKLPADVRAFLRQPILMRITKANKRSNIHRATHMDTVAVKIFDDKGKVVGERLFIGLFTSVAYSRSPREIPILREKVLGVLRRSGFRTGSHDGKALQHILETYPRDELFEISEADLLKIAMGILHLQERQRTALFLRFDPFERFVSAMVFVPRDRFDTTLRRNFQAILEEAYDGTTESASTRLTDAALAQVNIIVKTRKQRIPEVAHDIVESRLVEAARSWSDHLEEALVAERGEEQGIRCLRRFERAFSASYQEHFDQRAAAFDIAKVEEAIASGDLAMNLYRGEDAAEHLLRFKIYVSGDPVPLSDILPMLENMGLKVIGEAPFQVKPAGHGSTVWIHDFDMAVRDGSAVDLDRVRENFHEAFHRVWRGPNGQRRLQQTGAQVGAQRAPDHHAARLLQVPAPGSGALQPDLYVGDPGEQFGDHDASGGSVRISLRPGSPRGRGPPLGSADQQHPADAGGRGQPR